jgi:DNA-binding NarL/FixJ family response regulator
VLLNNGDCGAAYMSSSGQARNGTGQTKFYGSDRLGSSSERFGTPGRSIQRQAAAGLNGAGAQRPTGPTLVIADDHELVRCALAASAAAIGGFRVYDAVGDAQAAVNACARLQPDLLLIDLEMPGRDTLSAIAEVKAVSPNIKVVVLTGYCRESFIEHSLGSGADGYLLKSEPSATLIESLLRILRGENVISKAAVACLNQAQRERATCDTRPARLAQLAPRELEVLRYIARGMSNGQMAQTMSLSKRTVERHVLRLMNSLAIRDRAGLRQFAKDHGVLIG